MELTHLNLRDNLVSTLASKHGKLPFSFLVHTVDGKTIPIGDEVPAFEVFICNQAGLKAIQSLNQLTIAEAYMLGDLNIEGDLIKAISFQDVLSDNNLWIKTWRRVKPMLIGRKKCNPDWIAKHYDSNNLQLLAADFDYNTYTPGHYENDEASLENGAERKLACAFESLNLKAGDSVLDIGCCGWGGFLRYAARRHVRITGITLSRNQKEYTDSLIKENQFNAQVLYHDFFSYKPSEKYDGLVMMGVIEDLSDYSRVMKRIANWVKPGGRVYLDFASAKKHFGTASFITKYI